MENHQSTLVLNCPIYIVERDEKDRPTIAVILDPITRCIERMFVDLVYDLPVWVHHKYPGAVRVAPKFFAQESAKLAENENLVQNPIESENSKGEITDEGND